MPKDITCSKCEKVFGSEVEYKLHWSHNHYGPVPAPLTQPALASSTEEAKTTELKRPIPKDVAEKMAEYYKENAEEDLEIANEGTILHEESKADEEAPYSLATSDEGLGELYPVLMDAHGNVIDGFHRLGENPNWHTEVRPQIDTPVKLQLAMLAANFNRRNITPEEITQRITFLVKAGLKPEEIAKATGISKSTIYRHMPQDLKSETSEKISEGLKAKSDVLRKEVSRDTSNFATPANQTVKIPDNLPTPTRYAITKEVSIKPPRKVGVTVNDKGFKVGELGIEDWLDNVEKVLLEANPEDFELSPEKKRLELHNSLKLLIEKSGFKCPICGEHLQRKCGHAL